MIEPKGLYLSRQDYGELDKNLCTFCEVEPTRQVLKDFPHFLWFPAKSPYWSFDVPTDDGYQKIASHTLLIPKRHIRKLSELDSEETQEFMRCYDEVLDVYRQIPFYSEGQRNVMISSRVVFRETFKSKTTEHLHVHFSPECEGLFNPIMDAQAHLLEYPGTLLDYINKGGEYIGN